MTYQKLLQFKNCYLLRNHEIVKEDLWVRDGKIIDPEKVFFEEHQSADEHIDCGGALISPGFVELQINGGFGVDFTFNVKDVQKGLSTVAQGLLAHGVTAFCPTVITSSPEVYHAILPHIEKSAGSALGAAILGVHLEGPFINPAKKGAHEEKLILQPVKGFQSVLEVYGSLDNVAIVTLAPEVCNNVSIIRELVRRGITVSLGHSTADINQGEVAVQEGASFITHLFNAMLPFHHRDPGLVGLLASKAIPLGHTVYYGIISDGVHTHPAALRIAQRTHPKGTVLVTDAISALGLREGTHQLGQQTIEVRKGRAYLAGTDTLCGSIATMIECVRYFLDATGCSIVEALEAATLHPASAIKVENWKGTLDYGADADFLMLSNDLELWSTWIGGECVYQAAGKPIVSRKSVLENR
ncbi:N-acetylglucosamine-6-phosphate deacetylase [Anabrus simplex]|uniref:N-acetylglucosamine-6-phosphate deacetylase n=1 Tax=Anabrus simplex TaxID=316456 RepID=UPI0035A2AC4F